MVYLKRNKAKKKVQINRETKTNIQFKIACRSHLQWTKIDLLKYVLSFHCQILTAKSWELYLCIVICVLWVISRAKNSIKTFIQFCFILLLFFFVFINIQLTCDAHYFHPFLRPNTLDMDCFIFVQSKQWMVSDSVMHRQFLQSLFASNCAMRLTSETVHTMFSDNKTMQNKSVKHTNIHC